jgi:HSP20 family protein
MTLDLVTPSFWRTPTFSHFWGDEDDMTLQSTSSGSVSIAEDEKQVYVSASLPGVEPKDVEITFDKGVLWMKGETKEEEKEKKFYRKATSSFSYRIAVPGDIDVSIDPKAEAKHGVMTITFTKSAKSLPKKITVNA